MNLGFTRDQAENALAATGNFERALDRLLGQSQVPDVPPVRRAVPKPQVAPQAVKRVREEDRVVEPVQKVGKVDPAVPPPRQPVPPPPQPFPRPSVPSSSSSGAAASSVGPAVGKANNRLMRELNKMKTPAGIQESESAGVVVEPMGDGTNLYHWKITMSKFPEQSKLSLDLLKHGLSSVELDMTIPANFPHKPPFIRVVYPKLSGGFVFDHGAICFEGLTDHGWSPAMNLFHLSLCIKALLDEGAARVQGVGNRQNKEIPEYNADAAKKDFAHIMKVHKDGKDFGNYKPRS